MLCGGSLGMIVTWSICGILTEFIGWPCVFYGTGVIAILISIAWILVVYDCPEKHPRIDKAEIELIKNATVGLSDSAKVMSCVIVHMYKL